MHITPLFTPIFPLKEAQYHSRDRDPHHADDDIKALGLTVLVFITPHAVRCVVPICSGGGMHTSSCYWLGWGGWWCRGVIYGSGQSFFSGSSCFWYFWLVEEKDICEVINIYHPTTLSQGNHPSKSNSPARTFCSGPSGWGGPAESGRSGSWSGEIGVVCWMMVLVTANLYSGGLVGVEEASITDWRILFCGGGTKFSALGTWSFGQVHSGQAMGMNER